MPGSYARAQGFRSLGAGLQGIAQMVGASRIRDEELRRRDAAQYASDMLQPGVLSPNIIADASQTTPEDMVMLPSGVGVSRGIVKQEAIDEEEAAYQREFARQMKARDTERMIQKQDRREMGNLITEARSDLPLAGINAYVGGVPAGVAFKPTATVRAPVRASWADHQKRLKQEYGVFDQNNYLTGWKFGLTSQDIDQVAQHMAVGGVMPHITSLQDNPFIQQRQGQISTMSPGDIPAQPASEPEGPSLLTRIGRLMPGGQSPWSDAPKGAPVRPSVTPSSAPSTTPENPGIQRAADMIRRSQKSDEEQRAALSDFGFTAQEVESILRRARGR